MEALYDDFINNMLIGGVPFNQWYDSFTDYLLILNEPYDYDRRCDTFMWLLEHHYNKAYNKIYGA